ncbi:MAG: zinc-ribbon domain containing protein [Dehalococcoidia bacterium]
MEDKTLVCRDCGMDFVFSAGEQEFYQQRGLLNEPRRCPSCRRARKTGRDSHSDGYPREMFDVVCADCGVQTQVPFEPRLGRPVYCSDCFEKAKASGTY